MKTVLRKLKKHWITVWLIVVSVILGSVVTYAIYTEVSSVKRVVTTKSAPKELFSSNCMYPDLYERRIPAQEFSVNVCNYDQSAPDIPNPSDIEYTLTAQLHVKYGGNIMTFSELSSALANDTATYNAIVARATGYSIGKTQDNNTTGTITDPATVFSSDNNFEVVFHSETLLGGVVSTDRFKVTVPARDFDTTTPEFYVFIKADPVDSGLHDIQTRLYGSKNIVVTSSWSGILAERNTSTLDYDFYNYIITGSGTGKLDIMWDSDWFDVNAFFFDSGLSGAVFVLDDNGEKLTTVSGGEYNGWKKVTIEVDSSLKSRYELQLYKTKENISYTGENDAAKHIACVMQ